MMFDSLPPLEEVVVHFASYHQDRTNQHNETNNWGLGLHFTRTDRSQYVAGTYKNSQWKQSIYAGVMWEVYAAGPLSFTVTAGAITGYEMAVTPMLLPEGRLRFGNMSLIVTYVPGIFGFSIGRKF